MTIFDYLLNIVLVGLVGLQMRGRRLDRRGLLLPLGLVAWAASRYLHGLPTAGNDTVAAIVGALVGMGLGAWSGFLTRIHKNADGLAIAHATAGAAALWVLGIGARMGFALYTQHGGAPSVARFSVAHHLTGPGWVTAMVLMAFAEVISRTAVLWRRSRTLATGRSTSAAASVG